MPFMGTNIIERIDWISQDAQSKYEQSNREIHAPVISVYRWWARRPHGVIGALLDASRDLYRDMVISDPFSGGGTVAVEAARRGLKVYAQDLYPWPIFGLSVALSHVALEEYDAAAAAVIEHLYHLREKFRSPSGQEISAVLRVRVGECPRCNQAVYLYPDPLISKRSRRQDEEWGYFGCAKCGHVTFGGLGKTVRCEQCDAALTSLRSGKGTYRCPQCSFDYPIRDFQQSIERWMPSLVQRVDYEGSRVRGKLDVVGTDDPVEYVIASESIEATREAIRPGVETRRLLDVGFRFWGDLYTDRQANVLYTALSYLRNMDVSQACKDRIGLAILGFGEMPAFLTRWDRFHLKAIEATANHRYAHTTLVTEINPLSPVGRGTLPRRLLAARKALVWAQEEIGHAYHAQIPNPYKSHEVLEGATLAIGSSSRQQLPDGCVDLVLTDPPYFNDVQYGELARLFHFWLSQYRPVPAYDERLEASPNVVSGIGAEDYARTITQCLKESCRTLKTGGRVILTFHNRKIPAWEGLCHAVIESGLAIQALAIVRAENAADHTKRSGGAQLHDIVLELRQRKETCEQLVIAYPGEGVEANELVAIGVALYEAVRVQNVEKLRPLFETEVESRQLERRWIHQGR